jgi:hypothetical protein
MSSERAILGLGVPRGNLPAGGDNLLELRLWGRNENVHLHIDHLCDALVHDVPPHFLDLIDIATYVYVADQATTRGGAGVENAGADWRRTLFFRVPVRTPEFWNSPQVMEPLRNTLSFLSEDEYIFDFQPMASPPSFQHYFNFAPDDLTMGNREEVVLFSGGLDSLGGAVEEVVTNKRRVALVTHLPSNKFACRRRKLQELLAQHARVAVPVHFPVGINENKNLNAEYTQRSRSFLYAALGATVANILGLSRIRFYENGVISLNFHLSDQVIGAKATRTTHPRVLNGFKAILSAVAERPFDVQNPFLWKTKTDIVKQIAAGGCADMIGLSMSCSHVWELSNEKTHCGACSQCIDRRFAVLAAGQEANDPADQYNVDLLTDARAEGEPRTMLASYVETASQIAKMSALEFYGYYGEVGRVVTQLPSDNKDRIALDIFDLHQRHAKQVSSVVDGALAKYSTAIRERRIPDSSLLRLVCETATPEPSQEDAAQNAQYKFRKKGQVWAVRFAGADEWVLLPSRGAAYLHVMLSNPGKVFSVVEVVCEVTKMPKEYILGDSGDVTDKESSTVYRARAMELKEIIDNARENNDLATLEKAQQDLGNLLEHMGKDKGFHGQIRKHGGDREKVRKAFLAAMTRVKKTIAQYDSPLAEHLKAHLKCGWNPSYSPQDDVQWST